MSSQSRDVILATLVTAMSVFENVDSTIEQITSSIKDVRVHLQRGDRATTNARAAFEYWATVFDLVSRATTRDVIKTVVRLYICTPDPRARSKFTVAQSLMRAAAHAMWRRLYELESKRHRFDATRDATISPTKRGAEYMQVIYKELAAENNETVDEMMRRIHSECLDAMEEQVS